MTLVSSSSNREWMCKGTLSIHLVLSPAVDLIPKPLCTSYDISDVIASNFTEDCFMYIIGIVILSIIVIVRCRGM